MVKDEKLVTGELNNPLNDAKKTRDLFHDETAAFKNMDEHLQKIYYSLLKNHTELKDFFHYIEYECTEQNIPEIIRKIFYGKICEKVSIEKLIKKYPVELAYALAQINVIKYDSVTPPWVLRNYPQVENIVQTLRSRNCTSCSYCNEFLDETKSLRKYFHYDEFKSYDGKPLQQDAVKAAVEGKSILVIFPTGGGKSIAFQLPALMAGVNEKGLTVVISPLQSLMKDQTDNLETQYNITEAVTINSSLDPLERSKAFERIENGSANLLYISPELLRSKSIEALLFSRNIVRFVIDEAHCFSSWGQDFRVDYLYIGDFIRNLQEKKYMRQNIPVSCFTATAKQKVITGIKEYFKDKLSLDLELFKASAERRNLNYHFFYVDNSDDKYLKLRQLIIDNDCPSIVYVSRTRLAEQIAAKLSEDGYPAKPYHGRMDKQFRITNQNAFMHGEVNIIVATTAFGMGVDKKDVGMVIHYDISDSLENYVQEAGRAGRDEKIKANCYVLFNDEDLNGHFYMLNQTKVSHKEIQQIWKTLKELTISRSIISQSALEVARESGWDDSVPDMETRVKTAVSALEQSGFVRRSQNMPVIYADSIMVKNMEEAKSIINKSDHFDDTSRQQAVHIMNNLMFAKNKAHNRVNEGESRVDYISDKLGIVKEDVLKVIRLLQNEKILANAKDLAAYIKKDEDIKHSQNILSIHRDIELFLFSFLEEDEKTYNIKEMNEELQEEFPNTSIYQLNTILNYFVIKRFLKRTREDNRNFVTLKPFFYLAEIKKRSEKRHRIAASIIEYLYSKLDEGHDNADVEDICVDFSVFELKAKFDGNLSGEKADTGEIEDALYYLLKIGAAKIEGGFLVIYNAMQIERLEKDIMVQYRKDNYTQLDEYYKNKRQQIHIIGEYAKRMIDDPHGAGSYVSDYFEMDYYKFLQKYFKGRHEEINQNITAKKFNQLFGELSPAQLDIIKDKDSDYIVVAAGPGSGKTKLLTHKLASLYMMEDIKHEQMLMLTFSRAAATEFKKRLISLIGNAANFIQVMTFHSYCFDLLGRVGDIEKLDKIIEQTVEKINAGEVDLTRLTKTVLVIDEAQDMSAAEYSLVKTLIKKNENMRIIAVGDDDQNIYEFRGSSSAHFASLLKLHGAVKYELIDNYRSNANIVDFANQFALKLSCRLKTIPIKPIKKENGVISVCKIDSDNIVIPVVNAVLDIKPSGSTCIITRTNAEVLNISGLLRKNGINARQIQTNNDFNLYNLVEFRDLINFFDANDDSYVITDEVWQRVQHTLSKKYKGSENLPAIFKLIKDFEATNNKTKYKSDFKQFVYESRFEDFLPGQDNAYSREGVIFVSTIHQTKGREFDNVFLAFSLFPKMDDETKRGIYVAISRAKQNLHIVYNGSYFDKINVEKIQRKSDKNNYPEPEYISLQLSHRDVSLSSFSNHEEEINSLVSGNKLTINGVGCTYDGKQVLKFSKEFRRRIDELKTTGYFPVMAVIRHIVFWENDDKREIKIILPDIEFSKNPQ